MQNGVISRNIRTICKQWCSKNIFFRLRVLEAASSHIPPVDLKACFQGAGGRIYSPLAKIPPHNSIAATSPTARKHSLLFGGAYAPNDAIYRKRYAFTIIIMPSNFFCSGASPKTVINCFMPRLPATSTKKQPKSSHFDLFSAVFLYIFHKIGSFQLTTCLPDFLAFYWIFRIRFENSFSLLTATQILRADRFSVSPLRYLFL